MIYLKAENLVNQIEEESGRKVVYCARVGSYNYGLHNEFSDKDYKVFVMPTFEDLYTGNMYSYSYTSDKLDYTVHDVRKLISLWWKSNVNFIEVLFTDDYYIGIEKFEYFLQNRESIAKMNIPYLYNSCNGMYMSKIKRLHQYSEANEFMKEEYGYNTKEACHATRIMKIVLDLVDHDFRFFDAINYESRPIIKSLFLDIKNGNYSERSWELITKPILERFKDEEFKLKVTVCTPNVLLKTKMDNLVQDMVKEYLKNNL